MKRSVSAVVTFVIMYVFWLLISACLWAHHGIDYIRVVGGIICAGIVTAFSHKHRLFFTGREENVLIKTMRFMLYAPWLLWQIALANFDVAYRVLHPEMPINPQVIEFDTTLTGDISRTTLANSITLTPGTITIEVKGSRFRVHAIADKPAEALMVDQTMQKKVAHVFMEKMP